MARIDGVTARRAGARVRTVNWFARRAIGRVTGHQPERMIEPLEMYAHLPGLLRGYARLAQATAARATSTIGTRRWPSSKRLPSHTASTASIWAPR